ncbi:MAG: PTS sugar transporter subunit IIA [Desulfobacteraceae bacterium]|nr:PTS sugar transporter subunit IIA [Desulfobacteraceae bacterium]MBC2757078.1 PTS sugar transporter subunit IIA [Desulfobacteraceae bacterium]MBC2763705.1 PTS sugar transporter subunit IIA [ANME-2 cluster archaeon]
MKILDFLDPKTIITELKATDKKGVLEELTLPVSEITQIEHKELVRVLIEREHLGSTGIGNGIGIPHGKLKNLPSLILGVGLSRKGVSFDAMDKKPTHIFFLLLSPDNSTDLHLKLLARISKILKEASFKDKILYASDKDEVLRLIQGIDEEF